MSKQAIFFDIDGTIIDSKTGTIPQSTIDSIRQARNNGVYAFLCTGRCKGIWPKEVLNIGFDGVVGGCGTHIFIDGKEVFRNIIPKKLQNEIAKDMLSMHIDGVLEGPDYSYFRKDIWMDEVIKIHSENGIYSECLQNKIEDTKEFDFDKMALWYDETSDMEAFVEKYKGSFDVIRRDPTFNEFVPLPCSKASGIKLVCDRLGINKMSTIGIGDSTNDMSMLEYVGTSIAMGDGNPAIFDCVDYVTSGVMEGGIMNAMKYLGFI